MNRVGVIRTVHWLLIARLSVGAIKSLLDIVEFRRGISWRLNAARTAHLRVMFPSRDSVKVLGSERRIRPEPNSER